MGKIVPQPLLPDIEVCVGVPDLLTEFVARDNFHVDRGYEAGIPIWDIRSSFYHRFMRHHGKKETSIPTDVHLLCMYVPQTYRCREVTSLEAFEKIGGPTMAETSLYEIHWLIRLQRRMRPLEQLPPRGNHFFVRDIDDRLCMVSLTWFSEHGKWEKGWVIEAHNIDTAKKITRQSRIFYRAPAPLDLFASLD